MNHEKLLVSIVLAITMSAFLVVIIAFLLLRLKRGSKPKVRYTNPNKKDYFLLFYHGLVRCSITKTYTIKIRKRIEIVTPSDARSVYRKTARYTIVTLGISTFSFLVLLLLGDFSIYYIAMSFYTIYIISTQLITMLLEKEENLILKQLNDLLAEIRHNYHGHKMVDEAVGDSIEKVPYEISVHASIIYEILTSMNIEESIAKYNDIAPNKFLMTLLAICQTTMRFGDKTVDGNSMFLQNLNYLKQEINIEILKKERLNNLFSGLVFTSVLPIFAIKPLEHWCISNIPELQSYFQGKAGIISTVVVFLITILVYQTIHYLKDSTDLRNKEHPYLDRFIKIAIVNQLLNKEIARNYSKQQKMNDLLKKVGESINPKQFLLKRVLFFCIGVFMTLFVGFNIMIQSKMYYLSHFDYSSSLIDREETKEQMTALSINLIHEYKKTRITNEELVTRIHKEGTIKSSVLRELMAQEILTHINSYNRVYYKWYYLMFAMVIGFVFYQVPYLIILFRQKVQQMSMEDEVMQFQSIILMLMHIDRMDVYTILEWIERFSTIFKTSLNDCINNYEKEGMEALEQLKRQEPFTPFTRVVDNLISCEKIGIVVAFDEIVVERSYYQDKRKQDNDIMIRSKGALGRFIGFVPFVLVVFLFLVLPFLVEAMNQFSSISSELGGL